jgi:hypothetical protein
MTAAQLQWVAFGFLLLLVLFLMVAFFVFDTLSSDRRGNLRFLSSLCAGFAGGFLTGSALFQAEWSNTGGKIGVSGTAGFALFMIVFYGYRRLAPDVPNEPGAPDRILIDLPENWNFGQATGALAESGRAGIEFEDFTDAELKAKLRPQSLAAKSVADAMLAVRGLTLKSNAVRRYGVSKNGSTYLLKVK